MGNEMLGRLFYHSVECYIGGPWINKNFSALLDRLRIFQILRHVATPIWMSVLQALCIVVPKWKGLSLITVLYC